MRRMGLGTHVSGCAEADDIRNAARVEHLGRLPAEQAIPARVESEDPTGARGVRSSPYHQMARLGRDEAGPQKGWPGGQGFSCASVR